MRITELLPARMRAPVRQVTGALATALWVWPAVGGLSGVVLAALLLTFDPRLPVDLAFLDVEASRAAITTVIGATIAAVSLVVTGTIVALQLATGQYSPRLLRDALRDQGLQTSLALLVATVSYGLAVVPRLGGDEAPRLAVVVGVAGGFVGVAMLVLFLQRIVERLRLETIINRVVSETRRAIEATHGPDTDVQWRGLDTPDGAVPLPARRSGYVQQVSLTALADVAADAGVDIHLRPRIGSFLVTGTVVAHAWPPVGSDGDGDRGDRNSDPDREALADAVDRTLALGVDRTVTSDPDYGLRHLVDIALRGVSPGVNDPTTAVQCIDHLTGLLVEIAGHRIADGVVTKDGCTAAVGHPDLTSHLELARTQILHYGGRDPWVLDALLRQLRDLLEAAERPDLPELVRHHLDVLRDHVAALDLPAHEQRIVDAGISQVEDQLAGRTTDDDDTTAG